MSSNDFSLSSADFTSVSHPPLQSSNMNTIIASTDQKDDVISLKYPISTILLPILLLLSTQLSCSALQRPPPIPILPLPSSSQLYWQRTSMAMFLHFGPNTFTDSEWGDGKAHPSVFNPAQLNASQWVQIAKNAGFSRIILTAKHHDGFCLWPSEYTDYSVRSSPWRNGNGDIVRDLAIAAKEAGIDVGLYLSPWDRHEVSYGKTQEYNEYYMAQMTELLTRYGEIKEVWLDGAKGKGEGEKDMEYFFDSWFSLIHQLQPGAVIFSDAGPDTRWIGDEAGIAASTCWSLFNRTNAKIGATDPKYSQEGDILGHDWVPAECDVSIRPGWFWHPSEFPKSATTLLDIYYKSVGRNCLLLLNVPPNSSGLISQEDIQVLQGFNELRESIFSNNLAENAILNASSIRRGDNTSRFEPYNVFSQDMNTYWAPEENQNQLEWILYLNLQESAYFNVVQVKEPIHMGQRITAFHLEMVIDGQWKLVINGTTVGSQRLVRFPNVRSQYLKFVVDRSRAEPLISYLGFYLDQHSMLSSKANTNSHQYYNETRVLKQNTDNCSQFAAT